MLLLLLLLLSPPPPPLSLRPRQQPHRRRPARRFNAADEASCCDACARIGACLGYSYRAPNAAPDRNQSEQRPLGGETWPPSCHLLSNVSHYSHSKGVRSAASWTNNTVQNSISRLVSAAQQQQ